MPRESYQKQPEPNSWVRKTPSQKYRSFVAQPMGNKNVTEIPGIDDVLGQRLTNKGFDRAYGVLSHYLMLKKDEKEFKSWLNDTCGANEMQQNDCYQSMKEWCDSFL